MELRPESKPWRKTPSQKPPLSSRLRIATAALIVLLSAATVGYGADRLILKLAKEHQTMSPQLSMAAAMGGLFAGGLVALLAILILVRAGSSRP